MNYKLSLQPIKFYSLVRIIEDINSKEDIIISFFEGKAKSAEAFKKVRDQVKSLNDKITYEIMASTKANKFSSIENLFGDIDDKRNKLYEVNFINLYNRIIQELYSLIELSTSIANNLRPQPIMVSTNIINTDFKSTTDIQNFIVEYNLNEHAILNIIDVSKKLLSLESTITNSIESIENMFDKYIESLSNKFSESGINIINNNIVITDVIESIYNNINNHGDYTGDNKEISAYSLQKASIIIDMIMSIRSIILNSSSAVSFVTDTLSIIKKDFNNLYSNFEYDAINTLKIVDPYSIYYKNNFSNIDSKISSLSNINNAIESIQSNSNKVISQEEKQLLDFKNETFKGIYDLIASGAENYDIARYVIERKTILKKNTEIENAFFVCKLEDGNSFTGQAPGKLVIVPGIKPNEDISNILGSGFDEIRKFMEEIEYSHEWSELFLATSPSKSVDKSNILLIGPPGCGKTSVMRSIASDNGNVAIYAQGSDFLTCWKGEAEKNPKRLFEEAVKIQKNTKKHVHILIDEIDSVLVKPELKSPQDTNLSLEFQTLMDGIVSYPRISIWGTTNNPERIPLAMIRRFSKVLIVGKLTIEDRERLLKLFVGHLPTSNFSNDDWVDCAKKLDGATGDVIRKVADSLWRNKMTEFVKSHKDKAIEISKELRGESGFDIKSINNDVRKKINDKISKFVKITPGDLHSTIENHLLNVAINAEIEEAVNSYDRADEFVNHLRRSVI